MLPQLSEPTVTTLAKNGRGAVVRPWVSDKAPVLALGELSGALVPPLQGNL